MIEVERTGSLKETTASDRFRVSYPSPLAMAVIFWAGTWFVLAEVIKQGGLRACGIPSAADPLLAWVLYLFNAFAGPVSVLAYSANLEVDGNRLVWKRWFTSTGPTSVRHGSSEPAAHVGCGSPSPAAGRFDSPSSPRATAG